MAKPPRTVLVAAWLLAAVGALSVLEELMSVVDGRVNVLAASSAVVTLSAALALVRRKRWGYVVSIANLLVATCWGVLYFSVLSTESSVTVRIVAGGLVLAILSVPLLLLLSPSGRRWFRSAG